MIAVIFEVWPKPERKKEYLDIAAQLRPILEKIDGFISIERFESLTEPGKILSLSFFRNEARCRRGAQRTNTAWRKPKDAARFLLIIGYGSRGSFEITACISVRRLRTTAAVCMANRVVRLRLSTSRFVHVKRTLQCDHCCQLVTKSGGADIQSPAIDCWKLLLPLWTVWVAPPGRP